jgi:hypothetical protein
MRPKTTADGPGLPPKQSFASFIGRGLWLGLITLLLTAFLAWLVIGWMTS